MWSGTSQQPRQVEFQGRDGRLCLTRPSQVEEEEGQGKTIKFNDPSDSFSQVMGQMPDCRAFGSKLVVVLVKRRIEIKGEIYVAARPGEGVLRRESMVRRRLEAKKENHDLHSAEHLNVMISSFCLVLVCIPRAKLMGQEAGRRGFGHHQQVMQP